MIKNLVKIANKLDNLGFFKEADQIDLIICKIAATPPERIYQVKSGDTFSEIIERYGLEDKTYQDHVELNKRKKKSSFDPNLIRVGEIIFIYSNSEDLKLRNPESYISQPSKNEAQETMRQTKYIIREGDTFSNLSGGDAQYLKKILDANPEIDPGRLQVGQEINLPSKPVRPNKSKNYSQNIIDFIKGTEGGFYSKPYLDSHGNLTIGYGHKIEEAILNNLKNINGKYYFRSGTVNKLYSISESTADSILREDLDVAAGFIKRNISVPLTSYQFDALVSIVFNIGAGNFKKSEVYNQIEIEKDLSEVPKLIRQLVSSSDRGTGIVTRRLAESRIFESGTY